MSFLKIWLFCVNFEKFTPINLPSSGAQPRPALLEYIGRFVEANFSKLTHKNQIFRN